MTSRPGGHGGTIENTRCLAESSPSHRGGVAVVARPAVPNRKGLALAEDGIVRGLALRVIAKADERRLDAIDSHAVEEAQIEVVVRGVAKRSSSTPRP